MALPAMPRWPATKMRSAGVIRGGHGEENQLSGSVILGPQVLLITTEALFSAAVGQALDALAQVMNHQAGCLQAVTTLLKFCHHH